MDVIASLQAQGIHLARYHFGQHYALCPLCSHTRRKRHDRCLSVLIDGKGATWNCKHCGWKAGQAGDVSKIPVQNFDTYDENRRLHAARAIWAEAVPISDTLAERYLREERGITIPLPPTLKFSSNLYHGPTGRHFPALIAAVQSSTGQVTAIQRIFLKGTRKAPVRPNKMTLGPMRVGAVRLSKPAACLGIAEGIETALSVTQLYRVPCWAALGRRFDAVDFPPGVSSVIAFADNGQAGEEAAEKLIERHAKGLHRLKVRVQQPPEEFGDFNDQLLEGGGGVEAQAR